MTTQPQPVDPSEVSWERFNTDAHQLAQAACRCVIACAVDSETRKAVAEHLAYARSIGDMGIVPILIARLTGPCTLPPTQHRSTTS